VDPHLGGRRERGHRAEAHVRDATAGQLGEDVRVVGYLHVVRLAVGIFPPWY
jgi:hypothetical protein